jgi:phosphoserine phosphatase
MKYGLKTMTVWAATLCLLVLAGCQTPSPAMSAAVGKPPAAASASLAANPLPSWREGAAKGRIVEFVEEVTRPGSVAYVPEKDRLATFDMDGTIYCEKPYWLAMTVALDELKTVAEESPAQRRRSPYREAFLYDPAHAPGAEADFVLQYFLLVLETPFAGWTQQEYQSHVESFAASQSDARFGILYRDQFYRPMVELIELLLENRFQVYIVSGSDQALVRAVCERQLNLPPSHYIGSQNALNVRYGKAGVEFLRQGASVPPSNVGDGKPQNIHYHIGQAPVLAVGNTSDDIGMLTMATSNPAYPLTLGVVIDHDDGEREYAYQDARLLDEASRQGWLVVRMKEDFGEVFLGPKR